MESKLVINAFRMLECLANHGDGRQLADLAEATGTTKPTAHRILKTLISLGYVEKVDAGLYRQTSEVRRLLTGDEEQRLLRAARPVLVGLHEEVSETCNLGVLRHGHVVYLMVLESPQPLRRVVSPNSTDPFHCTALGRAIVAHLPEQRREFLLRQASMEKRTPETVTSRAEIKQLLDDVREQGLAVEENQTDIGVTCIAAPIFEGDEVVAALSVSLPTIRADAKQIAQLKKKIIRAVADITNRLRGDKVEARG